VLSLKKAGDEYGAFFTKLSTKDEKKIKTNPYG